MLILTRVDTPKKCLVADVWAKGPDGRYGLTVQGTDFVDLLSNTWKFKIIPVSVDDQHAYGINFLTLSKRKIVGVDGVSQEYKQALANAGVTATWIDFTHMKQGYGAAHCTTQVLQRAPE